MKQITEDRKFCKAIGNTEFIKGIENKGFSSFSGEVENVVGVVLTFEGKNIVTEVFNV